MLYIHTTFLDNIDNLDESFLREAETCKKYDPVKYARDFEGKWLDSDNKALLTKELLDLALNVKEENIVYDQVVVALDPAVSTNKNSDNTGIAVCGKKENKFYVIHVEEKKWTPLEWAQRAKELYIKYNADFVIYEENQGRKYGRINIKNSITEISVKYKV